LFACPVVHLVSGAEILAIVARQLLAREVGSAASDFVGVVPASLVPVAERLEMLELLGAAPVGDNDR
jgi:hypothetical protein